MNFLFRRVLKRVTQAVSRADLSHFELARLLNGLMHLISLRLHPTYASISASGVMFV